MSVYPTEHRDQDFSAKGTLGKGGPPEAPTWQSEKRINKWFRVGFKVLLQLHRAKPRKDLKVRSSGFG